jgi:hypothetical protein
MHEEQAVEYEKTEKILRLLLQNADLELWDKRKELGELWDRAGETSLTLQYLKTGDYILKLPPKAKPMAKLLVYLGLVESLGVAFMDMALMLLIANGKEMHTRRYVKHVTSLKELQKLDLAYKQYFLKSYDLPMFSKLVNRQLRNDIAHLKFRIEEDGKIKDSGDCEVDIDGATEEFWTRLFALTGIFDKVGFTHWLSAIDREKVRK